MNKEKNWGGIASKELDCLIETQCKLKDLQRFEKSVVVSFVCLFSQKLGQMKNTARICWMTSVVICIN